MVAVENCNDDDHDNGVGKGKLLGAFRNMSKCVGSCNHNGGSGSLIGIKFELDFDCCREQEGPNMVVDWTNLGIKKSSIGSKQYLDYL
jgi:hypothetical protein